MKLTVAIQMDPIEGVNIDADSTFALAEAAQRRGHVLWQIGRASCRERVYDDV